MKKIILIGVVLFAQLCAANVSFAATCSTNSLILTIQTDDYGSETSWEVVQGNTQIDSGSGYSSNQSYSIDLCLNNGNYTFTIYDSYDDGICCSYGNGNYNLTSGGQTLASGGNFRSSESTSFSLNGGGSSDGGSGDTYEGYYSSASGLTGYPLKTALYNIIRGHSSRSYNSLWTFYSSYEQDNYYENDGSIIDIYSERPYSSDPYRFTPGSDQCGTYRNEGDCYNREHSFPRGWFGGAVSPMNTDVHHIFPTDGKVNSYRSSYPYGEVGRASYTSENGSKLGSAASGLGYSGTVFEPIDEFKGDLARAYFYMATRYQNVISGWENNTSYGNAVLDGTSNHVFENWALDMLKDWHNMDPVSDKERDRNDAAYQFQGNRNPFVDHPEFVTRIWGN
ncbi:MAG: endonuclease [Reinekea sp.]